MLILCEMLQKAWFFKSTKLIWNPMSLNFIKKFYSYRSPIQKYPFYMLIETSGSNNDHDEEKLNKFLETAMSSSLVVDGFVTNEPSKMKVSYKAT